MEEIDITKIRTRWNEEKDVTRVLVDSEGKEYSKHTQKEFSGGDDTEKSLKLISEKVNEIIRFLTKDK